MGNSYNDRDNYYRVLGLEPGASAAEIREAYLDLVRVWHPDRFDDAHLRDLAGRKLSEINEAYNALKETPPADSSDTVDGNTWTSSAAPASEPSYSGSPLLLFLPRLLLMLLMVAGLGTIGVSFFIHFLNESARQLEAVSGRALRIAHGAGPDWADALHGWDGDIPRGMEKLLATYSPVPAGTDRKIQISESQTRSAGRSKPGRRNAGEIQLHDRTDEEVMINLTTRHSPAMPSGSGVGEIQLHNRTNEEVVIRLANARFRALRTINLSTGSDATFGGFDPDIYWVDVVFPRSARVPIRVGPLMFVETETAHEFTADCYGITLKPPAVSR